ncbi:MAG: hypothetical protein C0501_15070 [Isosphaera sp.]|nr:hypothetical protein [Isosphaera sp.]
MRLAKPLAVAVLAVAAGTVVAPVWADDRPAAEKPAAPPAPAVGPSIDLVLCLDISGSMNGLVDSAKLRLWDIVNELARLKPTPNLRVALYSYGGSTATYPAATGWVRKDVDLTEDLDDVYKALNGLTITGGTELVARVSKAALDQQKWSTDKNALRMIFVAGNEAVDQDKAVALEEVAGQAKKLGVVVNTIYCGPGGNNEARGWEKFAAEAGGKYMNIDQNKAVKQVVVKTEFDDQIIKLGEELNKTYVAYGKDGKDRAANQLAQDANAGKAAAPGAAPAAAVARAESKAGALYRNSTWDLVDRMKEKDFDLSKVKEEELCDELKKLKPEERLAFLKKKADERADIQKKISDLSAKRQKQIDAELAKTPKSDADKALDEALKGLIRDQAKSKGFEVPGEKK